MTSLLRLPPTDAATTANVVMMPSETAKHQALDVPFAGILRVRGRGRVGKTYPLAGSGMRVKNSYSDARRRESWPRARPLGVDVADIVSCPRGVKIAAHCVGAIADLGYAGRALGSALK